MSRSGLGFRQSGGNMPLSEYRNGEVCHCKNTEMEEYATVRVQKWKNMPLSEYRNRGICHCQKTEMEKYATVRIQKWRDMPLP